MLPSWLIYTSAKAKNIWIFFSFVLGARKSSKRTYCNVSMKIIGVKLLCVIQVAAQDDGEWCRQVECIFHSSKESAEVNSLSVPSLLLSLLSYISFLSV